MSGSVSLTMQNGMSFQGCDDTELIEWLFDQNNGGERLEWLFDQNAGGHGHQAAGHHGNHHTWMPQEPNVRESERKRKIHLIVFPQCSTCLTFSAAISPLPSFVSVVVVVVI